MREIKFRGKRVDGGWIYGDLIQYKDGSKAIISIPFSNYGYEATEILNRDQVIPSSVGQFTGLQDKNRKDIYEGDIDKKSKCYVKYRQEICAFELVDDKDKCIVINKNSIIEIIGNIHDKEK